MFWWNFIPGVRRGPTWVPRVVFTESLSPYLFLLLRVMQIRRAAARRIGTTYAPDFLGLMEVALVRAVAGWV